NKPTTQYPSTPGFISNHWYGRWGQVTGPPLPERRPLARRDCADAGDGRRACLGGGRPLAAPPLRRLCDSARGRAAHLAAQQAFLARAG
ncbi:hypothetical protein, partial [Xanthomonas campestris]|uniref:hypothetical protein n=1 Tax=Xanthomonas campestris TaxID=339 RepID=UPI002B23710B